MTDNLKKLSKFLDMPAPEPVVFADAGVLPYWIERCIRHEDENCRGVIVCGKLAEAEALAGELAGIRRFVGVEPSCALLPEGRSGGRQTSAEVEADRIRVLDGFMQGKYRWLVAGCEAMLAPTLPPERLSSGEIIFTPGCEYPFGELVERLVAFDYDDEYEVQSRGEFARHGGIIDIFSPSAELPVRLEFWGDQLETIREFDPVTQRTVRQVDSARIIPRKSADAADEDVGDVYDYIAAADAVLWEVAPDEIVRHLEKYSDAEGLKRRELAVGRCAGAEHYRGFYAPGTPGMPEAGGEIKSAFLELADAMGSSAGAGEAVFRLLAGELKRLAAEDWSIAMVTPEPDGDMSHLREWCDDYGVDFGRVEILGGTIPSGILLTADRSAILTEREFLGIVKKRLSGTENGAETTGSVESDRWEAAFLADLDDGDYAVHVNYGIGIFRGIREVDSNGSRREMMVMEFADGVKIMFPVRQANLIHRYIGSEKAALSKPGSVRWQKSKEMARAGVREYAGELLRLQAVRQSVHSLPMKINRLEEESFAGRFEYRETPDQLRSIDEINADLEGARPMDRLLCGDVGYGKTEVAMRAAFRAVASGYQVAVIAPTTVLAQQHFFSFRERFAATGFIIEMISRFQNAASQRDITDRTASGGVDILIGTHRLFSPDVKFRNPGLVIIDEEQRFGVKHKERLRRLRSEINVLTLSATPIPRTLYMALAGARDMSTILSAPSLRLPVETVVAEFNDEVICQAVARELSRGGQVFYLHNRINSIETVRERLAGAFPDARVEVAHGKMDEDALELIMSEFLDGRIDILVCTTIIESGLDVPNANTIIIERADRFGLAELYQLRGRVGRWKRQAYAWLLVPRGELMTDDGHKRIAAIRRYTHLGAGFKLALRDLEIRGAGNILGAEQSGHLKAIGFELYCQLLRQEVARMRDQRFEFLPDVEMDIDFVAMAHAAPEGFLPAAVPPDYIPSERLRVGAYRKLAGMVSVDDVDEFAEELCDRFGRMPACLENLLEITRLRIRAARRGIVRIVVSDNTCFFYGADGHPVRPADAVLLKLHAKNPLRWRLREISEILRILP